MSFLERGLALGARVAEAGGPVTRALFERTGLQPGVYGYPRMARAGLGHMLNTWARCFAWCHKNRLPMLAPQWRQLRIGPYVRRERDKRAYHPFFRSDGYVEGSGRLLCLTLGRRVAEDYSEQTLSGERADIPTVVVFYDGELGAMIGRGFDVLRDDHDIITAELLRITRREFATPALIDDPFIGIHVRCGDFVVPQTTADIRSDNRNLRVPIEWYAAALTELRGKLGTEYTARLFSDGSESELAPLLRLPRVELMPTRSAITDILSLSQARVLVASGSGFSNWAAFLGQMPSLWFPSRRYFHLRADTEGADFELDWEHGQQMPDKFLGAVAAGWHAPTYLRSWGAAPS